MSKRRPDGDRRLVHIKDMLGPVLERSGAKTLWTEARLRNAWASVVGTDVAAHARPARLRGTNLVVHVSSDAWATEFAYLRDVVIGRLNTRLGEGTVTEITIAKRRSSPPS